MKSLLIVALAVVLQPGWLQAAMLDNPNPQTGAIQSGVYPIFGWKCDAGTLTIRFDGTTEVEAVYGTVRADTAGQCGDTNNGFSLLWNWNLLEDGSHVVEALDDGVVFASVMVSVVTLGQEFPTGVSGTGQVTLSNGQQVTVEWSEPRQEFIIIAVSDPSSPITPRVWLDDLDLSSILICFSVSLDGTRLTTQDGSSCDAETSVRIRINNPEGCEADLEIRADIPIVNNTFSHTETVGNTTFRVNGTFQSSEFASGTVRATNNDTAVTCEVSWTATPIFS